MPRLTRCITCHLQLDLHPGYGISNCQTQSQTYHVTQTLPPPPQYFLSQSKKMFLLCICRIGLKACKKPRHREKFKMSKIEQFNNWSRTLREKNSFIYLLLQFVTPIWSKINDILKVSPARVHILQLKR